MLLRFAIAAFGTLGVFAGCGDTEEVEPAQSTAGAATTPGVEPSQPPALTAGPTATPAPSPATIPEDWQSYNDPVLGFSLRYPNDLIVEDLTGPSPGGGLMERTLLIRSPVNASRVLSISIVEGGSAGLDLNEWAIDTAGCIPDSIEHGSLGGVPAILCTREVLKDHRNPAIIVINEGRIILITNGGLADSEFSTAILSFQF